jgi:hypothetical protein
MLLPRPSIRAGRKEIIMRRNIAAALAAAAPAPVRAQKVLRLVAGTMICAGAALDLSRHFL